MIKKQLQESIKWITLLNEERQKQLMEVHVGNVQNDDYDYDASSAEKDQHRKVAYSF